MILYLQKLLEIFTCITVTSLKSYHLEGSAKLTSTDSANTFTNIEVNDTTKNAGAFTIFTSIKIKPTLVSDKSVVISLML